MTPQNFRPVWLNSRYAVSRWPDGFYPQDWLVVLHDCEPDGVNDRPCEATVNQIVKQVEADALRVQLRSLSA